MPDPRANGFGKGKIKGLDEWKEEGADYSKPIEGLQALDDHTIQIILNKPFPQLTYTFAMGFSSVTPREAVEYYGKEFGLNPVGSGPYKLKSFSTKKASWCETKTTVRRSSTLKKKDTTRKPKRVRSGKIAGQEAPDHGHHRGLFHEGIDDPLELP